MSGPLGLADALVEDLVRPLRPGGPDADPGAVLAAAAWTGLAEPGDGVAGALVSALGAAEALDALARGLPPSPRREVADGFARWAVRLDPLAATRAMRNAAVLGIRLLLPGDPDWPRGLDDLGVHAPLALWVLAPPGPVPSFARSVALVGARASSDYGDRVAIELACGLADRGFGVVSGAAYGIDGAAHRGALASAGLTVAVVAGGLDRLYPAGHAELLQRIAREGAVLSEAPCGSRPHRERFLKRNRLIAAASRATVVVEAGLRSGAANTAAHAATLGRPLGAVPGSVFAASSAGCHVLLRDAGAIAVRSAADAAELARDPSDAVTLDGLEPGAEPGGPDDPLERAVVDALNRRPRALVDVARRAGVSPADALSALGLLALAGDARESSAGWSRA